jgi:integrase
MTVFKASSAVDLKIFLSICEAASGRNPFAARRLIAAGVSASTPASIRPIAESKPLVEYAGHSLRAGHATSAVIAGASERSIMNQTGHRSVQMVRRYIRDGNLFRENAAGKLGL